MVDVFLVVVICVVVLILLISGVYFIVHYQHPDDRNDAFFPKAVVLGAFCLSGMTVLGLPLDVANNAGYAGCDGYDTKLCGGLDMELFWNIFFWMIPIWIFALIPFSTFFYDADDFVPPAYLTSPDKPAPKERSRLSQALCNMTVLLLVVALLLFITYMLLSNAEMPIKTYQGATLLEGARPAGVIFQVIPRRDKNGTVLHFATTQMEKIQPNDALLLRMVRKKDKLDSLKYQVDISTLCASLVTWLGWWLFALFGGIGLAALPMQGILSFIRRPVRLTPEEMDDLKRSLQERVNEMVGIGEQLKREREDKSKTVAKRGLLTTLFPMLLQSGSFREFRAAVHLLQQDVEDFTALEVKNEKYNPLLPYLSLLGGLVSLVFSTGWFLQTVLYTLPQEPVMGLLNDLFEWFDGWFPLFGTLAVSLFVLYLLLCTIQGCFYFGLKFLCLSFYPMKVGHTYMSSFLFNMGLVLFCALPAVQFAVISFEDYARYTTIRQTFVVQIEYLAFFNYFYANDVFVYILLVVALFTTLYLLLCQRKEAAGAELRDRLKARSRIATSGAAGMSTATTAEASYAGEDFEDEHDSDYD